MSNAWQFLKTMIDSLGGGIWKPYVYTTGVLSLNTTENIVLPFTVPLRDNNPFIWTAANYRTNASAVEGGGDTRYGGLLIKFDEIAGLGQGGNDWFMLCSMFGHANQAAGPQPLAIPVAFSGKETIQGQLKNVLTAPIDAQIDFIGVRKYA